MASCARAVQQADGSYLLALDVQSTDLTACAFVVESGAELGNSMFSMTAQDGGLYSSYIVGCWVVAFSIRAIAQILKGSENE
jgi:hypothetical protein